MMRVQNCYIHTIGCQMNVYDSERILRSLLPLGFRQTASPEAADLIILNTCAIREKAEQKVYSFLGRLAKMKQQRPELILGVGGCVAQQEGERILERLPHMDLVFGTHAVGRLAGHIEALRRDRSPIVDVQETDVEPFFEPSAPFPDEPGPARFVTIMEGCDNFCTYCVVPYVRGRETSRPPERILAEITDRVAGGVREVTLLGQNVNSYGKKEGLCSFSELLARVNEIDALARIRFTTSHPKDLSEDLIQCFASLDKLCRHIHLPVQSGSDRILKRMNRRYTRDSYLEKIARLRDACPDIGITSDFIVGFPGEARADFEATLELMRQVDFDGVFAFQYSDRPSAPASRFGGKVPEAEKKDRLAALLELQEQTTLRKNRALIGTVQQVMVEGPSKKDYLRENTPVTPWMGRTSQNRIVHFTCGDPPAMGAGPLPGTILDVRIEHGFSHSLRGKPISERPIHPGRKGVDSHAA